MAPWREVNWCQLASYDVAVIAMLGVKQVYMFKSGTVKFEVSPTTNHLSLIPSPIVEDLHIETQP